MGEGILRGLLAPLTHDITAPTSPAAAPKGELAPKAKANGKIADTNRYSRFHAGKKLFYLHCLYAIPYYSISFLRIVLMSITQNVNGINAGPFSKEAISI